MSRPRKMHDPLAGGLNDILRAVAIGEGRGKQAALKLAKDKEKTKPKSAQEKRP